MVFKPFTHLARQNFAKAFTHGYAQSVVAASQTIPSSSTTLNPLATNSLKFHRTSQLQSTFQNASSSSGSGAKAGQAGSNSGDSGLAAYYAAWQHAQQTGDDSDWRQFQFKRRIGWKPKDEVAEKSQTLPEDQSPRDLKKAAVNVDVSAKVEEAVAREIQIQEENAEAEDDAATIVAADENAADSAAHESTVDVNAEKSIVASGRGREICRDPGCF